MKQVNHSILRKAAAFALAGVMALSLAGCGGDIKPTNTGATGTSGQMATIMSEPGGQIATIVTDTPANKPGQTAPIALYPGYADMPVGFTMYLDCQMSDKSQPVEWSSSNPAAASVDADGKITGVAPGETVITAKLKNDPSATATCGVYVEDTDRKTVIAWKQTPAIKPVDLDNMSQDDIWNLLNGNTGDTGNLNETGGGSGSDEYPLEVDPGDSVNGIVFDEAEMQKILEKDVTWSIPIYEHLDVLSEHEPPIKYSSTLMIGTQKKGGDTPFGEYKPVIAGGWWNIDDASDYIKTEFFDNGGPDEIMTPEDVQRYTYTLYTKEAKGHFSAASWPMNEVAQKYPEAVSAFMFFTDDITYKGKASGLIHFEGHSMWNWEANYEYHEADRGGDVKDDVWTETNSLYVNYYVMAGSYVIIGIQSFLPVMTLKDDTAYYTGHITREINWRQVKGGTSSGGTNNGVNGNNTNDKTIGNTSGSSTNGNTSNSGTETSGSNNNSYNEGLQNTLKTQIDEYNANPDAYKQKLKDGGMTDEQIDQFIKSLQSFSGQ